MNRSILFPTFALACVAAPMAALLAGETPVSENALPVATPSEGSHDGARRLSPEECSQLREQVRIASEGGGSAPQAPASAPAKEEKAP